MRLTHVLLLALVGVTLAAGHRQEVDADSWSCKEETHEGESLQAWAAERWHKGWSTGEVSREVRKSWGKKKLSVQFYKTHDGVTLHGSAKQGASIKKAYSKYADAFYAAHGIAEANQVPVDRLKELLHAHSECADVQHFTLWEYAGHETGLAAKGATLNPHRVFGWVQCHGNGTGTIGVYYGSATAVRIDNHFTIQAGYDFLSRLIVHGFYRTLDGECKSLGGLEEETSTTSTGKEVRHEWTHTITPVAGGEDSEPTHVEISREKSAEPSEHSAEPSEHSAEPSEHSGSHHGNGWHEDPRDDEPSHHAEPSEHSEHPDDGHEPSASAPEDEPAPDADAPPMDPEEQDPEIDS